MTLISDTETRKRSKSRWQVPNYRYRYVLFEKGKQIDIKVLPYLLDDNKYDVDLSIIVPAYNEEARLPTMLNETLPVS